MIYGTRRLRIKKINDYSIKCQKCGKFHQKFYIYQSYFHVFFIPFYPFGLKSIRCECANCNDTFNEVKKKDYLSMAKTPIYLYSGGLIIAGLIILAVVTNINNQRKKKEFVNDPIVGDVYSIVQEETNMSVYYFMKIDSIKSDTLYLLHGALQYNGFVSTMNDSDYFVKDDVLKLLKTDLVKFLDSGYINSVERDYDINSRFNIEQ